MLVATFASLSELAQQLRKDLETKRFVLLYAYKDDPDRTMYARVVNIMSHGNYSLYEPVPMMDENKAIFRKLLNDFRTHFPFNPTLFEDPEEGAPAA